MKVLLDTNIVIHRETNNVVNKEIGHLFAWIDRLHYEKCIHTLTMEEIKKHKDPKVVSTFEIKMSSYVLLKTEPPLTQSILSLTQKIDKTLNDINDTRLLNEVLNNRVDFLISEDKFIHEKARLLNIDSKVFTIESFLEKVTSENPDLIDYKTLSVKKEHFGNISLKDDFFDSFRTEYNTFDEWFTKKSDEPAYICKDSGQTLAFLYIKKENEDENYSDINPIFPRKKRLKIGTFKVNLNGFRLGERFLKIIFDNAIKQKIDEIYVTIFNRSPDEERLIKLLIEWGFFNWGTKTTSSGVEQVYVRDFKKEFDSARPKITFPYFSLNSDIYLVPIYEQYHTNLFPDSILNTESPSNFVENEPFRNALTKVYVSRAKTRNLKSGDIIIFYRTGGFYKAVITTIGIVESVITDIKNEKDFISLCRKRSVYNNKELIEQWNYSSNKPFIVNFLYCYSFPHRINMEKLIDLGVIENVKSAPRGFEKISKEKFEMILRETKTDLHMVVP